MRCNYMFSLAMALVLVFFSTMVHGEAAPPAVGDTMPEVTLNSPSGQEARAYLGLAKPGAFTLQDLKAPVVIIEIFSMYCPYCQHEAPRVNELYNTIHGDPVLSGKVVIIGLGAGNTAFEVSLFKKKYGVPFPLFDDEDYALHQIIGKVRTPYFIVTEMQPDGARKVLYSQAGGLDDWDGFLDLLRQAVGR